MAMSSSTELHVLSLGLSLLMGASFVWLGLRDERTERPSRMALIQMGLLFLVNAIIFALYVLRLEHELFGLSYEFSLLLWDISDVLNGFTLAQITILAMLFPAPFVKTRKSFNIFALGTGIAFVITFSLSIWLGAVEHTEGAYFWAISGFIFWPATGLIFARWYIVNRSSEDRLARNGAVTAGFMVFALLGSAMVHWPFMLFPIDPAYGDTMTRIGNIGWNIFPFVITCLLMFIILIREILLEKHKRDVPLLSITLIFILMGLLNLLIHIAEFEGNDFKIIWSTFVVSGIFGLLRPLILIIVALRCNLFDLTDESIRGRTRILSLLIITVWASGFFEVIQAFIPLPQLLSAALIGCVLAFAIGWEDKVFKNLLADSDEKYLPIDDEFFKEEDPFRLIMFTALGVIISIAFGFVFNGGI